MMRSWIIRSYPALENKQFRALIAGGFVSSVGDYLSVVALGLFLYSQTGSVAAMSTVWFVRIGIRFVSQMYAGAIVDKLDNRTVIIVCIVGESAASLGLLAATWVGWPLAIVMVACMQLCDVFYGPAMSSAQSKFLTKEQLPSAAGINGIVFGLSGLLGPALAAVAYSAIGPRWLFTANALTFVAFLVPALLLKPIPPTSEAKASPTMKLMMDGIRDSLRDKRLLGLLVAIGILSSFVRFLDIVLVPLATRTDLTASGYGVLLTVLTFGGLIGAALAPRLVPVEAWGTRLLFALAPALLAYGALVSVRNTYILVAAVFLTGVGMDIVMVTVMAVLSINTATDMRGRVFAARAFVFAVGALPGVLLAAPVLSRFGVTGTVCAMIIAVALAMFSIVVAGRWRPTSVAAEDSPLRATTR